MSGDPAARLPGAGGTRLALPLALGAGLALRVAVASRLRGSAEWEADGFLWAWAERSTRALASGCRPSGLQAWWELCGAVLPTGSLALMRTLAIVASIAGLACAWELCRTVLWSRGAGADSIRRARFRLCLLWAVLPVLVWSGPRLVAELSSGALLCLLAAAFLRQRMAASVGTWLWLCVTGTLSLAVGGVVVALAAAVGLLAFLLPLPRASVALPVLGAALVSVAAAFGLARWQDDSRPWRPDTGPAYAVAALVEAPVVFDDRESALPEVRGDAVWRSAWDTLHERPAAATLADLSWRAQDLIAPRRFADGAGNVQIVLGIVDALLTGGALVLALRTLGRRASPGAADLPRWAAAAAALTLVVATIAGATGPLALSGVVLVVIALAAAFEPVEGSASRMGPLAGLLAGALTLTALSLLPVADERPPSRWLEQLSDERGQGRQVVALLSSGGPLSGPEELQLAQILMDPATPFLRRPLSALSHALAAFRQLPTDDDAVAVLVRAQVDCLHFPEAEELANTLLVDDGSLSPRGRMLADWVRDKARRARLDGLH